MAQSLVCMALSLVAVLALGGCDPDEDKPKSKPGVASNVKVPLVLSPLARQGEQHYRTWCKSCHGANAGGSKKGPSLIIYERSHHSDGAFYQAVRKGVKAHHWNFGDMPAIHMMTDQHINSLIAYVRELQAYQDDNGER